MTVEDITSLIAETREHAKDHGWYPSRQECVDLANALEAACRGWDADVQRLAEAHNARLTAEAHRDALRAAIREALEHDKEWDLPPSAVTILSRAIDTKEQS